MGSSRAQRYDRVAVTLHWLIALWLIGQIAFGFLLDGIAPRGTPARGTFITLHKSSGMVLFVLIAVRLWWRLRHTPPALPGSVSAAQQRLATLGHHALYACMFVMPLSGYIASNFSKYGVKFFGIALKPWGPDLPAVYSAFNQLHNVTAWVFTALILGHVAMALKHQLIDKDALLSRMSLRKKSS